MENRKVPKDSKKEIGYGDKGSASRFFYCAKASKKDRNEGCENFEEKFASDIGNEI